MRKPAVVYRVYAQDDTLLYVGVTTQLRTRIRGHRSGSKWWADAVRIERSAPLSWRAALAAEREQIDRLAPLHNRRRPFVDPSKIAVYTITLDRAVLARLHEIAAAEHRTLSGHLRMMFEAEIARHEPEQAAA